MVGTPGPLHAHRTVKHSLWEDCWVTYNICHSENKHAPAQDVNEFVTGPPADTGIAS